MLNPGDNWFWDASDPVDGAWTLWDVYTNTYGRGSQLILNIPPDQTGAVNTTIVSAVTGFADIINGTYGTPIAVAQGLPASAPCADLAVVIPFSVTDSWDQTVIVEDLSPQLIASYELQVMPVNGTSWQPITGDGIHGLEAILSYGLFCIHFDAT